jgi:hypothetical protein
VNAVVATPPTYLDVDEAEQRLREWGWQCGAYLSDEAQSRPYRETRIKEMVEIGKAWKANRDAKRERDERRAAAARKAAETRKLRRENNVSICPRCGHIYLRECQRCTGDPKYTALGKQTHDFHARESADVVLRITGTASAIDEVVAHLPPDMRDVLKRCYCDGKTPWRAHAWTLRMSWDEFDRLREAAVEAVAERLAKRIDAAL